MHYFKQQKLEIKKKKKKLLLVANIYYMINLLNLI